MHVHIAEEQQWDLVVGEWSRITLLRVITSRHIFGGFRFSDGHLQAKIYSKELPTIIFV